MLTFIQFLKEAHYSEVAFDGKINSLLLDQKNEYMIPIHPGVLDDEEQMGGFHICDIAGLVKLVGTQNRKSTNQVSFSVFPNPQKVGPGVIQGQGGVLCYARGSLSLQVPFDAMSKHSSEDGSRWVGLKHLAQQLPNHGKDEAASNLKSIIDEIDKARAEVIADFCKQPQFKNKLISWDDVISKVPNAGEINGADFRVSTKFGATIIDYNTIPDCHFRDTYWPYFVRGAVRQQETSPFYIAMVKFVCKRLLNILDDLVLEHSEALKKALFHPNSEPKIGEHDEIWLTNFTIDPRIFTIGHVANNDFANAYDKGNGVLGSFVQWNPKNLSSKNGETKFDLGKYIETVQNPDKTNIRRSSQLVYSRAA